MWWSVVVIYYRIGFSIYGGKLELASIESMVVETATSMDRRPIPMQMPIPEHPNSFTLSLAIRFYASEWVGDNHSILSLHLDHFLLIPITGTGTRNQNSFTLDIKNKYSRYNNTIPLLLIWNTYTDKSDQNKE